MRGALVAEAPVARWGMGYVQGGEVLLSRNPRQQADDVDFYPAIENLRADYIIAHASAPDDLSGNPNTQPFRYRKWMFAQEGAVDHVTSREAGEAGLLEQIPDFVRHNIKGKTLAERVFHIFLGALHQLGGLDDANLPPQRACEALADALRRTKQVLARVEDDRVLGNLMASNGRVLLAARTDQPLYMRRLVVPGPRTRRDDAFRGILVVSAAAPPGEGFEEIPVHSALLISREVRADIVPLRI